MIVLGEHFKLINADLSTKILRFCLNFPIGQREEVHGENELRERERE